MMRVFLGPTDQHGIPTASLHFFCGRRPLPGGSHLRLPSGRAGIRTTIRSLSAPMAGLQPSPWLRPATTYFPFRIRSKCQRGTATRNNNKNELGDKPTSNRKRRERGSPSGGCECSRSPSPFCSMTVFFTVFSVQRHVASARSFNSYPSLLQMRLIIEFTQGPML